MPLTKVSSGVIAANAVVDSFGTQSITGDKLGLTAINANNIVNASITGAKLAATTITGDKLTVGSLAGNVFTANTITGDKIGQSAISSNNISSITSSKLSDAGLVKITSGILSAAAGFTADGVFTSTYKNYVMYINATLGGGSNDVDIFFQFRASGSTNSTANYAFNVNYINAGLNAGTAASNAGTSTSWVLYDNMDDGSVFTGSIQFFNPQVVSETQADWNLYGADNGYRKQLLGFGSQNQSTSFDGINISMSGGNLTGTYDIYGVAR